MDAGLFVQAQDWLLPEHLCRSPGSCTTISSSTSECPGPASLQCKCRLHICIEEQETPLSAIPTHGMWLGLLARGAVFVKLTLPDGSSKATMDCSIGVAGQQQQQQQNSQQPGEQPVAGVLSWYGKTFHVGVQHLIKVVCSPDVAAAASATAARHHTGPSCLLAAAAIESAASQQYARMHWACLITRHVCLDIMVPDEPAALQHLSRFVNAILHTAQCCTGALDRQQQAAGIARSSSCPTDPSGSLSSIAHPAQALHEAVCVPAGHLGSFLTAVTCEAQLMQLLLDGHTHNSSGASLSGPPSSSNGIAPEAAACSAKEKHLLDAVANIHASQRAV